MRHWITAVRSTRLPHGRVDLVRQVSLFALAYMGYEVVRDLVGVTDDRPFANATRVIDLERSLHLFAEPQIQRWVILHAHWLLVIADWVYINAHLTVTFGALIFIYLRRNDSFYCVRNMFMIAMLIALAGYAAFPTAPPRLMTGWGFTDTVQQFTGLTIEHGPGSVLINPYAAIPSLHVCFAVMVGMPMSRLVHSRWARMLWRVYPAAIVFVVVVTGNHYFTDVFLGALTAVVSELLAKRLLARARPDVWAFAGVAALRRPLGS